MIIILMYYECSVIFKLQIKYSTFKTYKDIFQKFTIIGMKSDVSLKTIKFYQ